MAVSMMPQVPASTHLLACRNFITVIRFIENRLAMDSYNVTMLPGIWCRLLLKRRQFHGMPFSAFALHSKSNKHPDDNWTAALTGTVLFGDAHRHTISVLAGSSGRRLLPI
jgi:hypothetical protein